VVIIDIATIGSIITAATTHNIGQTGVQTQPQAVLVIFIISILDRCIQRLLINILKWHHHGRGIKIDPPSAPNFMITILICLNFG
jgi:hypothetical protein